MTPRPTPEQVTAARELLAAVAARLGETVNDGCLDIDGECVAGVSPFSGRVFVSGVAGLDRGKVFEAMPAASRTPNGRPSQVWEVVALIADRMAERVRRAPEMEALAASPWRQAASWTRRLPTGGASRQGRPEQGPG